MGNLAYAHCREDILQLVDKSNEARVVDVDSAGVDLPQSYAGHGCRWRAANCVGGLRSFRGMVGILLGNEECARSLKTGVLRSGGGLYRGA
jgi:hypothetical protein